jgi:hypothetical protein
MNTPPTVTAVRLSRDLINSARETGTLQSRSIAGQIEHWARLGRAMEAAPAVEKALLDKLLLGEPIAAPPRPSAAWPQPAPRQPKEP